MEIFIEYNVGYVFAEWQTVSRREFFTQFKAGVCLPLQNMNLRLAVPR